MNTDSPAKVSWLVRLCRKVAGYDALLRKLDEKEQQYFLDQDLIRRAQDEAITARSEADALRKELQEARQKLRRNARAEAALLAVETLGKLGRAEVDDKAAEVAVGSLQAALRNAKVGGMGCYTGSSLGNMLGNAFGF